MCEISREPLNGFATNSHGRRVWSLAWMSLKVKVKGQRSRLLGTKTAFLALSAVCVGFMFGKTSLASSTDSLLPVPNTILIMATNKLCSTVGKTKTVHKECTKDHSLAGRSNRFLIVPSPMRTTFTTSCTVRLKS